MVARSPLISRRIDRRLSPMRTWISSLLGSIGSAVVFFLLSGTTDRRHNFGWYPNVPTYCEPVLAFGRARSASVPGKQAGAGDD